MINILRTFLMSMS